MDRGNYAALLVLAGLILLANGAWVYPNEVSYDYTATYEAEQTDLIPSETWGRTAAGLEYLPERTYVDRNGTVYEVVIVESHREPTGWGWKAPSQPVVDLRRLSGWLAGVALLVQAGRVSVT